MDLGFSDEVVETVIFSIKKGEIDAAFEVLRLGLERRIARLVPAVSKSILLHDFENDVVEDGRRMMQRGCCDTGLPGRLSSKRDCHDDQIVVREQGGETGNG